MNSTYWLEQRKTTKRVKYSGLSANFHLTKNIKYCSGSVNLKRISTGEWKVIRSGRLILTNNRMILLGEDTKQIALGFIVDFKAIQTVLD